MASVNKVIVLGSLGRDPETRYSPDGTAFTNISVATSRKWKDKQSGEKREETEWHRISFAGRLAEVAAEYLRKGRPVYVEGRLRTRKWEDKDGQDRYTTEIVAESMQLLGGRDDGGREDGQERREQPREQNRESAKDYATASGGRGPAQRMPSNFEDMDSEIPF